MFRPVLTHPARCAHVLAVLGLLASSVLAQSDGATRRAAEFERSFSFFGGPPIAAHAGVSGEDSFRFAPPTARPPAHPAGAGPVQNIVVAPVR